jgi:hypothetical protein
VSVADGTGVAVGASAGKGENRHESIAEPSALRIADQSMPSVGPAEAALGAPIRSARRTKIRNGFVIRD